VLDLDETKGKRAGETRNLPSIFCHATAHLVHLT
jgi:hypothetical protein